MKVKARDFILFGQTFAALLIMEAVFRGFTIKFDFGKYFGSELAITILVSAVVAAVLFFLKTLFDGKAGKIIYSVLMGIISVMFVAQVVYYVIFETFFTFYSLFHSAQVLEFMDTIFGGIWDAKVPFVLLFAVGGGAIALLWKRKESDKKEEHREKKKVILLTAVLITAASLCGSVLLGSVEDASPDSPYQSLYGTGEIQASVKCSGLMGAMGVDLWKLIFGFEPQIEVEEPFIEPEERDNIIEGLDFEALSQGEQRQIIKTMHDYFGSRKPTTQNDKTGIFEGKNLIFITAESFTDFAIDPVYTPTLYKLQTEGYTFNNFYNPIWGVSTLDGEYVNMQSLLPKPGVWSMRESSNNELPYTLGNQFKNTGYQTKAYHNHSVYYYDRNLSHPNLGYDFKGQGREYSFKKTWPESDIEMVDKTTSDFLTPDENGNIQPFHIYYLTVSGHLNYNFFGNHMAMKNQDLVKDMDMSEACRAYMACNIEFDRAVELLLQRLEEAGQLENTVIAIAGDHYPYGLEASEISEFRGHAVDETYEMYRGAFILWTPGMEPEKVNKLCSNMDILPTISNMFGLEYDSRLLMGKDIFSDSEGFVVFKDKNWISDKGPKDALVGVDDQYVEKMDKKVADMFNYSALILDENYYSYLS